MADLEIRNLHVSAEDKEILKGLDLEVSRGEIHALMGPNGSGKSTLANAIMGHPALEITEGEIVFEGEDITDADPEERSRAGLFMAFQYPVAIPGVTVAKYLRMALNAHREARGEPQISLKDFRRDTEAAMELVNIPREFSSRYVNDGFSGGEKKRMEILQLAMLRPKMAVLDETDSGLDIDALRIVAEGVNQFAGPEMGVLIITHYQRILHLVEPDFVHVMYDGRIVKEGGPELVGELEAEGLRLDPRGGRGGGLRRDAVTTADGHLPDRERPGVVPGARARGQRQAGRLPRLRRQLAAGARLDPGGRPLRAPPPLQRPPRLAHALGRGDRRLRGRPRDRRRPHRRRRPPRARLRPQRDRGDQPRRPRLGRRQRRRRRPDRAHRDGAPLEHRPLAAARRARRRRDRLGAGRRTTGCSTSTPTRRCSSAGRSWSPWPTSPTCSGPRTRWPRSRGSRTRPARWCSPTAPRRRRSCRSTSPSSASTSTRSPATRPTARPGSAPSGRGSTCCARCRPSSAAAR